MTIGFGGRAHQVNPIGGLQVFDVRVRQVPAGLALCHLDRALDLVFFGNLVILVLVIVKFFGVLLGGRDVDPSNRSAFRLRLLPSLTLSLALHAASNSGLSL